MADLVDAKAAVFQQASVASHAPGYLNLDPEKPCSKEQSNFVFHLMLSVYADGEGLCKEPATTDPDLEPDEPAAAAVVHEDVGVVGVLVDRPPSTHTNLLVETFAS